MIFSQLPLSTITLNTLLPMMQWVRNNCHCKSSTRLGTNIILCTTYIYSSFTSYSSSSLSNPFGLQSISSSSSLWSSKLIVCLPCFFFFNNLPSYCFLISYFLKVTSTFSLIIVDLVTLSDPAPSLKPPKLLLPLSYYNSSTFNAKFLGSLNVQITYTPMRSLGLLHNPSR